jgi:hypothetical protein
VDVKWIGLENGITTVEINLKIMIKLNIYLPKDTNNSTSLKRNEENMFTEKHGPKCL